MTYKEFHEATYRHFRDYFSKERGWHFTMRKDGGVFPLYASEKSGYVATSFWRIVSREGMKLTPTVAVMVYKEENHFFYKFALKQRRSPIDAQDESVLKLIQGVRVKNIWRQENLKESRESSKDWTMSLYSEENYSTLPDLFAALEADLEQFIPQVDELIESIKVDHPEFEAFRFTADDLAKELAEYDMKREARIKSKPSQVSKISKMDFPVLPPLNQILYGPPGTGKTYATIEMAVRIANPDFTDFGNREALHTEFRRLKEVRRIAFTTFHQSLSYEDFVEGIRPVLTNVEDVTTNSTSIDYEIKDGVFKELVSFAATVNDTGKGTNSGINLDLKLLQKAQVYKMSLGDANNPADEEIYRFCIEQNCIALGYGEDIDFSEDKTRQQIKERIKESGQIPTDRQLYTTSAIAYFKLEMQREDIVLVSNGNRYIRAIGVVNGDYEFREDADIRFSQFRPVRWLQTDLNIPIKKVYGKAFSQMTLYRMDKKAIANGLMELAEETHTPALRNHVLIIDEINRGNVSAILGELITLLEPDKRLGAPEELKVTLPYSREEFGVPPNLYLIGTMNTADRSVEALDAALRRRFTFQEVGPDPHVIKREHDTGGQLTVGDLEIDLAKLLALLNRRIKALKDADHQIGHSYFLRVNDWKGLASAFNDRIIPLLREYFFANYGQLQLVVGKGFCRQDAGEEFTFAASDEESNFGDDYKSYHFPRPGSANELADYLRQLGLS